MRHMIRGRISLRGVTPRRLSAAKRALKRECDKLALFADEVAAEQPSPEERIEYFDLRVLESEQAMRDLAAKHWRWGRGQLQRYPEHKKQILGQWATSWCPPEGTYFADFVRTRLRRLGAKTEDT
jgi:hypothetical protein